VRVKVSFPKKINRRGIAYPIAYQCCPNCDKVFDEIEINNYNGLVLQGCSRCSIAFVSSTKYYK
jgi:uncharacterized C2H2 Zn-finger protein